MPKTVAQDQWADKFISLLKVTDNPSADKEAKKDGASTNKPTESYKSVYESPYKPVYESPYQTVLPSNSPYEPVYQGLGGAEDKNADRPQASASQQPKEMPPIASESKELKDDRLPLPESKDAPTVPPQPASLANQTQHQASGTPVPPADATPEVKDDGPPPTESKHGMNIPLQSPATVAPPPNVPSGKINAAYVAQHAAAVTQARQEGKETIAVKHPNPLATQPAELTKLQAQRAAIANALSQCTRPNESKETPNPALKAQQVQQLELSLKRIDQAIANFANVTTVSLGEKYKDEDTKVGWRTESLNEQNLIAQTKDPNIMQKLRESNWKVTKHFTGAERENAKLNIKADGTVQAHIQQDKAGKPAEQLEYVMDPTGQMYQFAPGPPEMVGHRQVDPRTNKESIVVEGALNPITNKQVPKEVLAHHSSVLAGAPVAGAGVIKVKEGKITTVTNYSGHYKPSTAALMQTVEELLKQGALMDKQYVMFDEAGKIKPLEGNAKKLYDTTVKSQAKLPPIETEYVNLTKILEERAANEQDTSKEEAALKAIEQKLIPIVAGLQTAEELLAKMGVGPANRMGLKDASGESKEAKDESKHPKDQPAKVQYPDVENAKDMTGVSFLASRAKEQSVPEFLTSGGDYRNPRGPRDAQGKPVSQADLKKEMLKELKKEKGGKHKDDLDQRFSNEGQGGNYPSAAEMAQAAAQLEGAEEKLAEVGKELFSQQLSGKSEAKHGTAAPRSEILPEDAYSFDPSASRKGPQSERLPEEGYHLDPDAPGPADESKEDPRKGAPKPAPAKGEARLDPTTPGSAADAKAEKGNTPAAPGPRAASAPKEEKIPNREVASSSGRNVPADVPPEVAAMVQGIITQEQQLQGWVAKLGSASSAQRVVFEGLLKDIQTSRDKLSAAGALASREPSKEDRVVAAARKEVEKVRTTIDKCWQIVEPAKSSAKSAE
jgi:hypothetical protein